MTWHLSSQKAYAALLRRSQEEWLFALRGRMVPRIVLVAAIRSVGLGTLQQVAARVVQERKHRVCRLAGRLRQYLPDQPARVVVAVLGLVVANGILRPIVAARIDDHYKLIVAVIGERRFRAVPGYLSGDLAARAVLRHR